MHLHRRVAAYLTFFFALSYLTSSHPTRSAFSNRPDTYSDLLTTLPHPFNSSLSPAVLQIVNTNFSSTGSYSSSTNLSPNLVTYWTEKWTISTTLSLTINISACDLSPSKIFHTLSAAQVTVGKKQAAALLNKKFTQETGSRINTMIFEISPGWVEPRRLTWADVGEVLGEDGLPKFFQEKQEWHNVYFDVVDSARGELGQGAIRKWYTLPSVDGANDSIGLGSG